MSHYLLYIYTINLGRLQVHKVTIRVGAQMYCKLVECLDCLIGLLSKQAYPLIQMYVLSCQEIYKLNSCPTYGGLRQLWKQLNSTLILRNANKCNHDTEDLRKKSIESYICHIIVKRSKFVNTTPFRWIDGVHDHTHGNNMSGKTSAPCEFFDSVGLVLLKHLYVFVAVHRRWKLNMEIW